MSPGHRQVQVQPLPRGLPVVLPLALALLLAPWAPPLTEVHAAPRMARTPAIQRAIDRGRSALLPSLENQVRDPPGDYPMGRVSLSLAAVLKAGAPSDHRVVERALEKLEGLPLRKTYSVACYLFALDAYWQARYRESLARQRESGGRTAVGPAVPRTPPRGPVRKKMVELVAWLVKSGGGTWDYGGHRGGDHSNTQFAILGLEIGIENDIDVPVSVHRAIAEHFVASHIGGSDSEEFLLTFKTPAWEGVTTGVVRRIRYVAYPGGWAYRSSGDIRDTMTAAGVSSLMVARKALRRAGEYQGKLAWEVDRKIESGLAWITRNWGTYLRSHRWVYYGLYSVEKVGDIGGIVAFGKVNWYQEGAGYIVAKQKPDGSWGDEADTALALLFLTRATRSHLQTLGPPVLFTRVEGEGAEGSDLVYIERLQGFVSTALIFDFLLETRDPKVLSLAEDALEAYPPQRVHEILARVLALWTEQNDAVTRFARETAPKLTGVASSDRADQEKILRDLQRMRELERSGSRDAGAVTQILERAESPILKRRAIDYVDRLGLAGAFGALIGRLMDPDADVRRRAREVLVQWTGESHPPPRETSLSGTRLRAALEEAARPWQEWWKEEGEGFRIRRTTSLLIARLGEGGVGPPGEPDETVRALTALGKEAAPVILEAMERDEYDVRLVKALEEITGRSPGLRPDDWRPIVDSLE